MSLLTEYDVIENEEHNLMISFLNVRSLTCSFNEVKDYILMQGFDLVGLTETWLKPEILTSDICIDGYTVFRSDRFGRRGGGVALYIKMGIRCCNVIDDIQLSDDGKLEQIWVKIKVNANWYTVGVVYMPPDFKDLHGLEETLSALFPSSENIICMGDLNINMLNTNTAEYIRFSNILRDYKLRQIVEDGTRVTASSGTLLDVAMISAEVTASRPGLVDLPSISDHYLVYFFMECMPESTGTRYVRSRDLKNIDVARLNDTAGSLYWLGVVHLRTVDSKVEYLYNLINHLLDSVAPYKTFKITKKRQPWITPNIKCMMRLRNKAYTKYKKLHRATNCHEGDLQSKRNYYRQLRNLVTASIRREKKAYIEQQLQNNISSRKWWKAIEKLGIHSSKTRADVNVDSDSLNNHFIDSVPKTTVDDDIIHQYGSNVLPGVLAPFSFNLVTCGEVLDTFGKIKSNAAGVDGYSLDVFRLVLPFCLEAVTHIINCSLEIGSVPSQWKIANIIPIPKIDKPQTPNDFRPISILPLLSKVLERIVYSQMVGHIHNYSLIPIKQSGFRTNHSTVSALADICDDYLRAIDQSMVTTAVMIDLSRAFDCLNHRVLLAKLHYLGFSDAAVDWFGDYLRGRFQRVSLGDSVSDMRGIGVGVPQGSILGPILFTLYTSDLYTVVEHSTMHSYADDTQICLSYKPSDFQLASERLNDDLQRCSLWYQRHGLQINSKKTSVITFKSGRLDFESDVVVLRIGNEKLKHKPLVRNLGVVFDECLTFTEHVSGLVCSSFSKLKTIYSFKKVLPVQVKIKLANSLILSKLEYGNIVYGPCLTENDTYRIQKVQNSCTRFALGIRRREHITQPIRDIGWLSMRQRWKLHLCCCIHKVMLRKQPAYLNSKLSLRSQLHEVNLRFSGCTLNIPKHKSLSFKKSFSYLAPYFYNQIPIAIRALSLSSFKNKLRLLIFNDVIK